MSPSSNDPGAMKPEPAQPSDGSGLVAGGQPPGEETRYSSTDPPGAARASRVDPEDENRKLAAGLAARGVPPEEIARLLAMPLGAMAPVGKATPMPTPPVAEQPRFVPRPTILLPPVRESSIEEQAGAEKLLQAAMLSYRRERFVDAEVALVQALGLTPADPVALELYGDVCQAVGRVDDAVACYKRATEVAPDRASAERKYGDLMLQQDRSILALRSREVPRSPHLAVLLSVLIPGAGQAYNGQWIKAAVLFAGFAALINALGGPMGFRYGSGAFPTSLPVLIVVAALVYVYAVIDANLGARARPGGKSGWDV